jgi:hypothetical protein
MSNNLDEQIAGSSVADQASKAGPVSLRTSVFVVSAIALALACVFLALQFFVADRMPELTEAALEAAEQRWQEKGPDGYDMDIEIQGAQPGNVHVEVRKNQVTAMTRDGRMPPQRTWDVWSVPGLFDMLERELVMAEDPHREMDASVGAQLRLRCEFDPRFGLPWRYHRHVSGGGPELHWRVTNFETR